MAGSIAQATEAAGSLSGVAAAIREVRAGRPVLVVDDATRENEGDLVLAGATATPAALAFLVRHTSGLVCVPMQGSDLDRLRLPPMVAENEDPHRTAFSVSVDARQGVSTGISAADRCHTIRLLSEPGTRAEDLVRPGHVFPLRAAPGGLQERRGHTEAAVALTRLAGLPPVAVIAEVVDDDGSMARLPRLREFADEHRLSLITVEELVAFLVATTAEPDVNGEKTASGQTRARSQLEPSRGEIV